MNDKNEVTAAKSILSANDMVFGKLRFQVYKNNQTHIHDDEQNLVFVWNDCQAFRLMMDAFVRNHPLYPREFVVRSDPKAKTTSARKLGDLSFKNDGKQWTMVVVSSGTSAINEVGRQPTLEFIDQFVQKY